jgi:hypothetical protein
LHAGLLQALNMKILEVNVDLQTFINNEKCLKSSELLKMISQLKQYGAAFKIIDKKEEEQKENSSEFDFMWKDDAQVN